MDDTDEVYEDGALSDDEAVATTSQADILAIARRSSVSFVPIPSTASHSSSSRAGGRQLGLGAVIAAYTDTSAAASA